MAAQPLLGLNNVPSPTKSDTPGGGSNFGRPAGNPLGQQSFWEQMSVFPDGTPRPNTAFGNAVSGGYTGNWQDFHNGGGQSPYQSSGGSGQGGATSGGQSGSNQGWQPQPVGSNTGMDFGGLLQSMLGGVNNNISSAGFGGGQQGGGWQHNYQPAYFPYANNSGLGFGAGTAGMYLRPQEYIPGTQTTWAGDLPQANNSTNWAGDRPFISPQFQQQQNYANQMAYQIKEDQAIAKANRQAREEESRRKRNDPSTWDKLRGGSQNGTQPGKMPGGSTDWDYVAKQGWMLPGGTADWKNVGKNVKKLP